MYFYKLLSVIYGAITRLRNLLYDRGVFKTHKIELPVICVGNLTVGGNSKTPLVHLLCTELSRHGYQPVVITRGYKGRLRGPVLVTANDEASIVGDEALMLAKLNVAPVVIAADRVLGAQFVLNNKLGNLIILDDGFQHRRLHRDLNILAVNVTTTEDVIEFTEGELLPYGKFREELQYGVSRADMIVLINRSTRNYTTELPKQLLTVLPEHIKIFRGQIQTLGISSILDSSKNLEKSSKIVAFCAIANPAGFFDSLDALGFRVCVKKAFRDHYLYTWDDLKALQASYPGVPLVCTTKDAVKIDKTWGQELYVLNTTLQVEPKEAFIAQVIKSIHV